MLRNLIAFIMGVLMLSSPVNWMTDILGSAQMPVHRFCNPLRELEIAENHFNFCDPEYTSAAIFELNAAESRLNILWKEIAV